MASEQEGPLDERVSDGMGNTIRVRVPNRAIEATVRIDGWTTVGPSIRLPRRMLSDLIADLQAAHDRIGENLRERTDA